MIGSLFGRRCRASRAHTGRPGVRLLGAGGSAYASSQIGAGAAVGRAHWDDGSGAWVEGERRLELIALLG